MASVAAGGPVSPATHDWHAPVKPTVFVVDDDASMLHALSRLQTLAGYAEQTFPYLASTNYFDIGGATNMPAKFYRVRLGP